MTWIKTWFNKIRTAKWFRQCIDDFVGITVSSMIAVVILGFWAGLVYGLLYIGGVL